MNVPTLVSRRTCAKLSTFWNSKTDDACLLHLPVKRLNLEGRMPRIAHLTSAHNRTDVRIFLKECRSLAQTGYEVTLLVADGLDGETRDGVRMESVSKASGRMARMAIAPLRLLRKALASKAELYHLHDPELIPIGLVLKARGAKVIFDAHEDLPKQILTKPYLPWPVRRIVSKMASLMLRAVLPWFDGLVAATPPIRDSLLHINKNSIDINNYPIREELNSGARAAQPARSVCYIGGISQIRGVFELVSAMALLPTDIRLKLAGHFQESATEDSLKSLEGWSHVDYLGTISRAEVREAMAASVAGIVTFLPVPNHLDSQPNKMFEYMSAGLPVIGSDFPLWKVLLGEGPCGICVDPLDPKSIADAILTLVSQPELAFTMGQRGQRAVRERFNWEAESVKLAAFYRAILATT